jgi:putative protein kinase ArgK-like GTPase of G3E family
VRRIRAKWCCISLANESVFPGVRRDVVPSLATISAGGKRGIASALALIETARGTQELATLLDDAVASARAHVTGLTGPPGVGKSTLTSALLRGWRAAGEPVVADTVVLCIQPASGDSLQFMKAGVMELPDVVAVTKADLGAAASRARSEAESALTLFSRDAGAWHPRVVLVSASRGDGLAELQSAIDAHRAHLAADKRLQARRLRQVGMWTEETIRARFGSAGVAARRLSASGGPFTREFRLVAELERRLGAET